MTPPDITVTATAAASTVAEGLNWNAINAIAAAVSAVAGAFAAHAAWKATSLASSTLAAQTRLSDFQRRAVSYDEHICRPAIVLVRDFMRRSLPLLREKVAAFSSHNDEKHTEVLKHASALVDEWNGEFYIYLADMTAIINASSDLTLSGAVRSEIESFQDSVTKEIENLCTVRSDAAFDALHSGHASKVASLLIGAAPPLPAADGK